MQMLRWSERAGTPRPKISAMKRPRARHGATLAVGEVSTHSQRPVFRGTRRGQMIGAPSYKRHHRPVASVADLGR